MDEMFLWGGVVLGALFLALPVFALVVASSARSRTEHLNARLVRVEQELAWLRTHWQPLLAPLPQPAPTALAPESAVAAAVPDESPNAQQIPSPNASETVPATPPVDAPGAAAVAPPAPSLEERIGITWFTRIGAAVLVLGTGYFFKYAVDNAWVGPWGRIAAGAVASVATLAFAERLRRSSAATYVHALLGVGLAIAYVTAYALYGFYNLVPLGVSFVAVAAVSLVAAALSVRHHAGVILAFALAAALADPVLLSSGGDRLLALAAYVVLVTTGAYAVSLRERFARVPWLGFAGTVLLGLGWADAHFKIHGAVPDALGFPTHTGAYTPLAARIVPLVCATLVSAQWIAFAFIARARDFDAVKPSRVKYAALVFVQCATAALLYDHDGLLALTAPLTALLALAVLDDDTERRALALTIPVSFAVLGIRATDGPTTLRYALLAGAFAWGSIHLAALATYLRRARPDRTAVLAACGAALGPVAVLVASTPDTVPTLRAIGAALAGTAVFALAVPLVSRGNEVRPHANALLGVALALFATTLGLAFSGVTVTVLWAALAATVAWLAGRSRDPQWRLAAFALYALVLARVVAVDVRAVTEARELFVATRGARGEFLPAFVFNARALALAATTLSMLVGARELGRDASDTTGVRTSAALAAGGYLCLLVLCVTEASRAVVHVPVLPSVALDPAEFDVWFNHAREVMESQRNAQAVTATLVMGVVGAIVLGVGFVARNALHRLFGIGILGLTVLKLLLWDLWNLPRLLQVIVLLGTGVLLLGAGLLYARYGKRLLGWIGVATALFAVVCAHPSHALANVVAARFHSRVPVVADAPGLASVTVPPELYGASRSAVPLDDVRIVASNGVEIPWVREPAAPEARAEQRVAVPLDPVTLADGSTQVTFDLARGGVRHDEVDVSIGAADFVRTVRVETSDDRLRWGLIGTDRVYRIAAAGTLAEKTTVRHPVSAARYVRLTFVAASLQSPLPVTEGTVWLRPATAAPVEGTVALMPTGVIYGAGDHATTFGYDVTVPGVPLVALVLSVAQPTFEREVRVASTAASGVWVPSGGGWIYRTGDAETSLRVPVDTHRVHVRVQVRDRDDAPLTLDRATGVYAVERIIFAAPVAGTYTLLAGNESAARPAYDLAERRARGRDEPVTVAHLGVLTVNPDFSPESPPPVPWTERHRLPIGIALAVLVGAMALWAVGVLRRG